MYEEIVEKILKSLDEVYTSTDIYPKFSGDGYKAHKIDIKNFHEIKKLDTDKKIAFIDGGNAEIIGSANFSLCLIRVCSVTYQNNKKISSKKFETFVFVKSINQSNEIHYKTIFFKTKTSIEFEEVSFNSLDPTIMTGMNRADIGSVASALRRFSELKFAKTIADEKLADIIVLDGNLQSTLTGESRYLDELYKSCIKNNIILTSLSKTTSLFTDNGGLLSAVLGKISTMPAWFYSQIADINSPKHQAEMFFVKLHSKSTHVFRFEIFNQQKTEAEESIKLLSANCIDPTFIGYPYGLVDADRLARVSNAEKESLKTIFLVKLKSRNIEKYLISANAHEILDKISF